jgi:hypothetical protein
LRRKTLNSEVWWSAVFFGGVQGSTKIRKCKQLIIPAVALETARKVDLRKSQNLPNEDLIFPRFGRRNCMVLLALMGCTRR